MELQGGFLLDGPLPHLAQLIPGFLFFPVLPDLSGMGLAVVPMIIGMLVAPFLAAAAAVVAIGRIVPVPMLVITAFALALTVRLGTKLLLKAIGGGREGFSTTTASAKQRNLLARRVPSSCLVCFSPSIPGESFSICSFISIECYTASPQVGRQKGVIWEGLLFE
jgi:hypothetical protein